MVTAEMNVRHTQTTTYSPPYSTRTRQLLIPSPMAWMTPSVLVVCEYIPIIFASLALPAETYRLLWFEPKYITLDTTLLNLAVCISFIFGFLLPTVLSRKKPRSALNTLNVSPRTLAMLYRCFWIAIYLTFFGYLLFYVTAIAKGFNPAMVLAMLSGQKGLVYEIKTYYFATIPGVTTCTQFGVAAVLIGTLLGHLDGWKRVKWLIILTLILTLVRAVVLSERLALIEVAVPSAMLAAFLQRPRLRSRWGRSMLTWGPATAPFVLYLFFTIAEYFRSWSNFYVNKGASIWEFSFARLLGYYATSLNNSAFRYSVIDPPSLPYYTLEWFWYFPGIGDLLGLREQGKELERVWMSRLRAEVNPEFNNEGGMYLPLVDYGVFGGLLWWFVIGIIGYYLHRRFCEGRMLGLLLFPVFFLGLLEGPRILYWTNGRAFPHICYLLIVIFLATRRTSAART